MNCTFENYVTGPGSVEAYHILRDMAEGAFQYPGFNGPNLIFLRGGVGTGKTHLLRACEGCLNEQNLPVHVRYLTADDFAEELLEEVLRSGSLKTFLPYYDQFDVLLMDDLHTLEGRDSTQELLAAILERFWNKQKVAILAGDKFPKFIQGLDIQLVDLPAPDYGVQLEILRRTAAELGSVPETIEDIILQLAKNEDGDMRTLIGSFKQTVARLQLLGEVMEKKE